LEEYAISENPCQVACEEGDNQQGEVHGDEIMKRVDKNTRRKRGANYT